MEAIKAINLHTFASTLEKGVIGKGVTCIFKPGACLVS